MNIFKTWTLQWWQVGIFKVALLAIGLAAGSYWSEVFLPYLNWLIGLAIVASLYSLYHWARN